jgi:chaperone BCS1
VLDTSSILGSGALLVLLNSAAGSIKEQFNYFSRMARDRIVTTIDITNQDRVFYWLESWMSEHAGESKNRSYSVTAKHSDAGNNQDPNIKLTPAPGLHFFKYKGRRFWMTRHREKAQASGRNGANNSWIETFSISTLGGNKEMVYNMVMDMYRSHQKFNKTSVTVKVHSSYGEWRDVADKPFRHADSIILPGNQMQEILDDLNTFFENKQWYQEMGIPWKRGYLLYGPPGNGKSSVVLAMATHLKCDVHIVNLANADMDDADLAYLMASTMPNSIVLFEEIDTIFEGRKQAEGKKVQQITFGGLLNALDGVTAPEGRVIIMTTNHPEKLDPALVRPGRTDMKLELKNATHQQVIKLFSRFYPTAEPQQSIELEQVLSEHLLNGWPEVNMAAIQELALINSKDPNEFIIALDILLGEHSG